jgi:hypothetical protein
MCTEISYESPLVIASSTAVSHVAMVVDAPAAHHTYPHLLTYSRRPPIHLPSPVCAETSVDMRLLHLANVRYAPSRLPATEDSTGKVGPEYVIASCSPANSLAIARRR